jgi:hypothetical protein
MDVRRLFIRRREMQKITRKIFGGPLIGVHIKRRSCVNREQARCREMKKYEFSLILKGSPELTEEIADQLFGAGCDDGTPGTCNGVFSIDFHREADSLETAINSAIQNVKTAGYDVEHVQIEARAMPQPA